MYIDTCTVTTKGRAYKRILLRESYRDNSKVKKRTIANLSTCSDQEVEAIKLALAHRDNLAELGSVSENLKSPIGDQ